MTPPSIAAPEPCRKNSSVWSVPALVPEEFRADDDLSKERDREAPSRKMSISSEFDWACGFVGGIPAAEVTLVRPDRGGDSPASPGVRLLRERIVRFPRERGVADPRWKLVYDRLSEWERLSRADADEDVRPSGESLASAKKFAQACLAGRPDFPCADETEVDGDRGVRMYWGCSERSEFELLRLEIDSDGDLTFWLRPRTADGKHRFERLSASDSNTERFSSICRSIRSAAF